MKVSIPVVVVCMSFYLIYVDIQCLPIDKKDDFYTIFIICRRLQSDCHCHCIGSPEAGVMCKSIVQARRHRFKNRYRLDISGISSVLALEYSSVYFLLYTPQVGRIRTFLQTTPATASAYTEAQHSEDHCGLGANSAVQSPFASSVHDSYTSSMSTNPARFGSALCPTLHTPWSLRIHLCMSPHHDQAVLSKVWLGSRCSKWPWLRQNKMLENARICIMRTKKLWSSGPWRTLCLIS
jgi:hypothetical protein